MQFITIIKIHRR